MREYERVASRVFTEAITIKVDPETKRLYEALKRRDGFDTAAESRKAIIERLQAMALKSKATG